MTWHTALRIVAGIIACAALVGGCVLGYITLVAIRRHEGVFLPAGCVAVAFLVLAGVLVRYALTAE